MQWDNVTLDSDCTPASKIREQNVDLYITYLICTIFTL